MTKEEFLDKKNIDIIKKVETALSLKSEIDVLTSYLNKKLKDNPGLICRVNKRKVTGVSTNYWVHQLFIELIEMLDRGELIHPKEIPEICDLPNPSGFSLFFRDEEGNLYDSDLNPITNA